MSIRHDAGQAVFSVQFSHQTRLETGRQQPSMRWGMKLFIQRILPIAAFVASTHQAAAQVWRQPDFSGRDKEWSGFKTRIREGIKSGSNFAKTLRVIEIGCGTGCRIYPVVDLQTGQVFSFPLGGEDYQMLSLSYSSNSPDVLAKWSDSGACYKQQFHWAGRGFTGDLKTQTPCD